MEKLHCPGCKSEHITVHSRRKYLAWAILCVVIIGINYTVLNLRLLKPGEWDAFKMVLILINQSAFCIALIMGIYYFFLGVTKKHTSYFCRDCHHEFDNGLVMQHNGHRTN